MLRDERNAVGLLLRVGAAVALVGVATAVRLASWPILGARVPFVTFFVAVALSCALGGVLSGAVALGLSIVAARLFLLEPRGSFVFHDSADALTLLVFAAAGGLIILVSHREQRARARAERAVRERSDLLAIVSHDLRNPLGAVTMGVSLIARHAHDAALVRARVEPTLRACRRMERLIGDLLDASAIENGSLAVDLGEADAHAIVEEVLETFRASAAEKALTLRADLPEERCTIRCDRARIVQALSNLVANAIRFSEHGVVSVAFARRGGTAELAVADEGSGIAPEHVPHLFDRYFTRGGGGTGLGLFIVSGILRAHGGSVTVESEIGRGSRFVCVLPGAVVLSAASPAKRADPRAETPA